MQSYSTCHAEHKYDVTYDVLEKNHELFFLFLPEPVQTVIVMKQCLLIQEQNAEQCFLRSFVSLLEVKHGEAGAKPTPTVLLMFLSTSIQEHSELSFQFKGV